MQRILGLRVGPRALPNASDLAYLVYTSGSTGKPKGVEIGQKNLLNFAQAMRGLYGHGAALSLCNIGFDVFILESIVALINGRTIVLPTEEEQGDPEKLAALITGYAVGNFAITPSRLEALLKNRRFARSLSGVESIICGGEHFPGELIPALRRHTGARIYNQYGPSETTVGVSYRLVNDAMLLTIGRPMENCRMYILDSHLMPLPIGVYGELYLGGMCVGRGYHNRDDLTLQSFLQSPFEMGERIYRTGDIGCWTPEGEILLGGRKDNQIKLRGLRIEPQEIASRLALHPEIEQAAVKVLNREGRMLLAAYYTASREIPETELFEFALSYLPSYMLPTSIKRVDVLPLTANGKVDYAALPDPVMQTGSGKAETALQEDVLNILRDILKKPEMGMDDDYFLCGGDSLNGMEAIARVEQKCSVCLHIADFYACRTARRLCQKAGRRPERYRAGGDSRCAQSGFLSSFAHASEPLFRISDGPGRPFLQHARGILSSEGDRAFSPGASVHPGCFEETLLRTGFVFGPAGLGQKVFSPTRFALNTLEAESFEQAKAQFVRPFQLEQPPLLRAAIWRDQAGRDVLLWISTTSFATASARRCS